MKNLLSSALVLCLLAGTSAVAASRHSMGPKRSFVPAPDADAYLISFSNDLSIDTRVGEPVLPEMLKLNAPAGPTWHIVQFSRPIEQSMLAGLSRLGLKPMGYLPRYAVLAKFDPALKAEVSDLPDVNWVGLFQPAYKLEAGLLRAGGAKKIVIAVMPGEDHLPVTNLIADRSGLIHDVNISDGGVSITATVDSPVLAELARLQEVLWLQEWGEPTTCNNMGQWITQTGWQSPAPSNTDTIARRVWQKGVRGQRVVLGVTDTGFNVYGPGHDMFRDPSLAVTPPGIWPDHRKAVCYKKYQGADATEGQYHGSHVCGTIAGNDSVTAGASYYDGMSPFARIYFMDLTSGMSFVIPTNFWSVWDTVHGSRGLPDSAICYQHSGSWGWSNSSGTYLIQDASTDAYNWAHKDFLNIMAAGNESSTRRIRNPGIAKNVVTVGALQNGTLSNQIASFSSRGPTQDGRIKPTICAPGQGIYSSTRSPATNTYSSMDGTSMATPMTNGAIGLIRCYLREGYYPSGAANPADTFGYISAALLRSMTIASGDPNVGSYVIPSMDIGWGRIDVDSVLYFAGDTRKLMVLDDTTGLATGTYQELAFRVDTAIPLKVSLVWTDTAGATNANPAIVNDLNLEVVAPNGTFYRGNQYTSGQSTPNPTVWDNRNVEECVRVNNPAPGVWTIRVYAQQVVTARQPFAWTVTGAVSDFTAEHDIGVTAILAPTASVDSGATVTPTALVRNFGTFPESLYVRFSIGSAYLESLIVGIQPGLTDTVRFPDWFAAPVGEHAVTCTTLLAADANPANNALHDSVRVNPLTGIAQQPDRPLEFALEAPRPNPFADRTDIRFSLPEAARVRLDIYSSAGQLVRSLAAGSYPAGRHQFNWDRRDSQGRHLGAGVYLLKFESGTRSAMRKLIVQ